MEIWSEIHFGGRSLYDMYKKLFLLPLVTGLVQQYGLESILIYTAILLKKRIVVYASSLESLLRTCRSLYSTVISSYIIYIYSVYLENFYSPHSLYNIIAL